METGTSRVRTAVAVTSVIVTGILVVSTGAPATAGPAVSSSGGRSRGTRSTKIVAPTITALVSATPTGGSGNDFSNLSALSSDGRVIAWSDMSTNLVAGDTNGKQDVFVRDMV